MEKATNDAVNRPGLAQRASNNKRAVAILVVASGTLLYGISQIVAGCKETYEQGLTSTKEKVLARTPQVGELCLRLTVRPGQNLTVVANGFRGLLGVEDNQRITPELEATKPAHPTGAVWPGDVFAACEFTGVVDPTKLTAAQYIATSTETVEVYRNLQRSKTGN